MSRCFALLLGVALLPACSAASTDGGPAPRHEQVVDILLASADAWNRGDLTGFLEPYEDSDLTSYAGRAAFVHGFDRLRDTYARGFWADGPPADSLAFDVLELRPLDDRAALMLGRYHLLSRSDGTTTSTGIFSLVWILTDHGWKITHDHTAETP